MDVNNCADISEMIFLAAHQEEQEVIEQPKGVNKMYTDYAEGTWVKIAHWNYTDFVGYILESNPSTKTYKIQLTQNKHGYKVDVIIALSEDAIYPADIETDGFDTSFLHDLAINWCLDTKNEEYFYQLVEKKGGNEDVEK